MAWRVITRYDPNKSGIQRIAVGLELRAAVTSIAEQAKGFAELTSPSGFEGYEYQFEVDVDVIPDIPNRRQGEPMARVAAAVVNQSRLATLVEVGGKNSEEYRVLTRTLKWIDSQAGI
jgi:hypothetical protein